MAALADINTVRSVSGGLAVLVNEAAITAPVLTGDRLLDELIYNKRYSLVWEQGIRWLDARKYGILAQLPHDDRTFTPPQTQHVVFPYARLPDNECNARNIAVGTGICAMPTGL